MLRTLISKSSQPLSILCLGAHSDDLEIGCGGTLLRLLDEHDAVVRWVVLGCSTERANEARSSAGTLLEKAVQTKLDIHDFRDGFFPYVGGQIKDVFEALKGECSPDLILTHTSHDRHQDHRLVNELTWNTYRDHLILEYEVPKYDGDLRSPNLFVHLDDRICDRKIQHLLKFFSTQASKRWFDEETFRGLMRLRGGEAGVRYAEAFYCRKMVL